MLNDSSLRYAESRTNYRGRQTDADRSPRKQKMAHRRSDRSWAIKSDNFADLFIYLAIQKITYLYDDELFEGLKFVDHKKTGKSEESLDAYLVLDQGDEIQLKLFQFKFREGYDGGISTKELYAFVDRMNRVFLRGDLQDAKTLEAFKEVRVALDEAREGNKRARTRIQCYYIVNGQNVSRTDADKVQEIRDTFSHDRQTFGFTFETYGGVDIYSLCAHGRVPIQDEILDLNYEMGDRSFMHHKIGANPNGMPEQVLVGFANVNQLIRLVDRYSNNELFEKNVRLFLGTGEEVNRRIIETVTGNQSVWFGFMNNGVSMTADALEVAPSTQQAEGQSPSQGDADHQWLPDGQCSLPREIRAGTKGPLPGQLHRRSESTRLRQRTSRSWTL